ncbi:LuxR C-terminal-related transcriptional regulator [Lentzea sp. NPDC005914]|uniref:LuxR C-terminal-related transcriptional regulator n=1 Tax=Lentzea sp. NPDC005914 TaxID=3154572 RepID=UPI003408BD27
MQEQLRGRQGELAALRAAFEAAVSRGRLAVVRGEPGSGRSELLRQAAAMWRAEGVTVVGHRPRSRAVVLVDDADELDEPVLTTTAMRMPGCLVIAVCRDHAELAEVADVVIDLPTLSPDVVTELITTRDPLDQSVVEALRTALGPLYGNPGTVLATLGEAELTWVGDRLFLAGDRISLPGNHPLLEHVQGLAYKVALLCVVRQGIEVADLKLLQEDLDACGRALDDLVERGVLTKDLKVLCPALANAIIDRGGEDEVRRMHVALAADTADPDLVALAGPDLPDAPRRARWLADRAAEIQATDPERAGRWLAAAVRMTQDRPCGRLLYLALAVLVATGQDELMRTVLKECMAEDANTDAAAMLLLLNGEDQHTQGGQAVALARWWLGERPDWTPLPMNAHDDEVVITNAELNAIYHALRSDVQACRTALRFVRDEQARERFDDIIEAGTPGDVATVLELVLGQRYRTPDHGPLKLYQRVVRDYAKADFTSALQTVRQLELTKRPMPAHHHGRILAAAMHSARGEHRQAFAWLAKVSHAVRYAPTRAMVECGLLHRAGDSQTAVNLAWRTLQRVKQAGVRTGTSRLMLQALQIAMRNNDLDIARTLMTEIMELHRWGDCRCTLQVLLLARGLLYNDPAEAARGADLVRRRGHRPDLLWACHILAQFCDDPRLVVRELHAIAKEGGSSFLLPARVSALMRRFGVMAPHTTASPAGFTATELRIVELVRSGQTNRQIATELETSEKAVEHHLTRLFMRTGVRSRVELAAASLAGRLDDRGATG